MAFYAYIHVRPSADANGAFYVGKGRGRRSHDFTRRNPHHRHIIDKYGPKNIDVARIECSSEASAFDLERGLIKCLRSMKVELANVTEGGEGVSGLRHSEAARAKMSADRKGRSHRAETRVKMAATRGGQNNAFFGRRHSEETKQKIAETKKANPTGYWRGKQRPDDTKAKISKALTGRVGTKHTEASKAKLSAARKGMKFGPLSPETRTKISIAIKEAWRKRKQTISGGTA